MQGLESLNQFQKFVSSLGGLGRFEDTYMIHAAEGETVVPMEVLDRNPVLKKRLFKSMKALGIDPGRYIVGNDLNSLNPVTGQPEFFLSNVWKRVKKGIADASGYVAPIVGAMYGPAAGAAVGAAMGAFKRENPGDPSQWAKMGALGGMSGIMANVAGGGGEGTNWLTGKGLSGRYGTTDPMIIGKSMLGMEGGVDKTVDTGYYDKFFGPKTPIDEKSGTDILKEIVEKNPGADTSTINVLLKDELANATKAKASVLAGMSIGDAALTYGLSTAAMGWVIEQTTSDEDAGTRIDPYIPHGKDYGWMNPHIDYDYDIPIVPGQAEGGIMDLQGGGHAQGPGTGTSDSIPAMLSDGEFVMTADAVRGAGGGNRREGARKMYEAMDRLEARA